MKMYNEEGTEANVAPEQKEMMEANGWTRTKPSKKTAEVDETDTNDDDLDIDMSDSDDDSDEAGDKVKKAEAPKKKKRKAIKK